MSFEELAAEINAELPEGAPRYGTHPCDPFIRNLHLLLGHNKAKAYLGVVDPDPEGPCLLCKHGF